VVKSKKLWGGRFAGRTVGSVETFTASIDVDSRLYRHDIEGSIAHARMLARRRIISSRERRKSFEVSGRFKERSRGENFLFPRPMRIST